MKILICDKVDRKVVFLSKYSSIEFDYQPKINNDELLEAVSRYDGLLVRSRTKVTDEIIKKSKRLKVIGRAGSGVDNIDLFSAKNYGVQVVNTPGSNSQAVVELTIALIISLLRKLNKAYFSMDKGLWIKKELRGNELSQKKIGIVGYGHIGKKLEKVLLSFGCKIDIFSLHKQTCSIEKLFQRCDIISIHLSLTPKTKNFISKKLIKLMKPNAFFINIARGGVVDEKALYNSLKAKKIAGAALDVYWNEPLIMGSPWRKLKNVILTPHIGASTSEALERSTKMAIDDMIRVFKGKEPKNKVV